MPKILIIDDSPEILNLNTAHLIKEGFDVATADTGAKAIARLKEGRYDCIILDIMLPDTDGFAVCKAARDLTSAPIIFLSCLDSPDDKVKGLMIGGDDYMTKPYSLKELAARIHVHLRREQPKNLLAFGSASIDKDNRIIHTPDKYVLLSQKEFELFMFLFENLGRVFSKEEIYSTLWQSGSSEIGTVAVHILKLRRKLGFAAPYVGTIETSDGGYFLARNAEGGLP
ncbi:MAG: response regulator transcription factor [Defluviitaleaceae bacterium]|nr:response regulator transcription factor [Defluviitaleaceae bacterium]